MNKIVFTELAYSELQDAIQYYEFQLSGLGVKFKNDVEIALKRISEYPNPDKPEPNRINRTLMMPIRVLHKSNN